MRRGERGRNRGRGGGDQGRKKGVGGGTGTERQGRPRKRTRGGLARRRKEEGLSREKWGQRGGCGCRVVHDGSR